MPILIDSAGGGFWNSPSQCNPDNDGSNKPTNYKCKNNGPVGPTQETSSGIKYYCIESRSKPAEEVDTPEECTNKYISWTTQPNNNGKYWCCDSPLILVSQDGLSAQCQDGGGYTQCCTNEYQASCPEGWSCGFSCTVEDPDSSDCHCQPEPPDVSGIDNESDCNDAAADNPEYDISWDEVVWDDPSGGGGGGIAPAFPPANEDDNGDADYILNTLLAGAGIGLAIPADGPAIEAFFGLLLIAYASGIIAYATLKEILERLKDRGITITPSPGELPPVGDIPIGGVLPSDWPDPVGATFPRPKPPTAPDAAKETIEKLKEKLKKDKDNKTSCNSNTDSLRPGIGTMIASSRGSNVSINGSDIYGPQALPSFTSNNQVITAYEGSPPSTFPVVLIAKG